MAQTIRRESNKIITLKWIKTEIFSNLMCDDCARQLSHEMRIKLFLSDCVDFEINVSFQAQQRLASTNCKD